MKSPNSERYAHDFLLSCSGKIRFKCQHFITQLYAKGVIKCCKVYKIDTDMIYTFIKIAGKHRCKMTIKCIFSNCKSLTPRSNRGAASICLPGVSLEKRLHFLYKITMALHIVMQALYEKLFMFGKESIQYFLSVYLILLILDWKMRWRLVLPAAKRSV